MENKKVKIMVDKTPFKEKPTSKDVSLIQNRLKDISTINDITLNDLINYISLGYTIRPAVLKSGATENDFVQQEIIFVDVDNKKDSEKIISIEEILDIFKSYSLKPCFYYETFSSTKDVPRYRVIFILDKPIVYKDKMNKLLDIINNLVPNTDTSCATVSKLFYGTTGKEKITVVDLAATVKEDEIIDIAKNYSSKEDYTSEEKINQLIKNFDLLNYIMQDTNKIRETSKYIAFDECPICSHNDCLRYYKDTNSFYCFGSNGQLGGSIIEYLMATKNLTKKESIKYFKESILNMPEEIKDDDLDPDKKRLYYEDKIREQVKSAKEDLPIPIDIDWVFCYLSTGYIKTKINGAKLAKFILANLKYFYISTTTEDKVPKYFYESGVYKNYTDNKIKKIIKYYIPTEICKYRDIMEVFNLMGTEAKYVSINELNTYENLINFKNGILDLKENRLIPHSPKYLITIQLPIDYKEYVEKPKNSYFDNFLEVLTNGDKEQQELILEFYGTVFSNIDGSKMKQSLVLCGKGNTGKSKALELVERIIGEKNYSSTDLRSMEKNFSRINLLGKRLASFSDVTTVRLPSLDSFKKITGGDSLNDSYKNKDSIDFRYKGVVIMTMNEFIKFGGDDGTHVWERFIPIETVNVIPEEKRDKLLVEHMLEEIDYIIYKSLNALKNVIKNGYNFTIPKKSIELRDRYRIDHNSALRFIKECVETVIREPESTDYTSGEIYRIYKAWAKDNNNNYYESPREFKKAMLNATNETTLKKTHGGNFYYRHIDLTDEVKRDYGDVIKNRFM